MFIIFLGMMMFAGASLGTQSATNGRLAKEIGILIDHFGFIGKYIPLDGSRYAAIILLIVAVIVIMKSYRKLEDSVDQNSRSECLNDLS